MPELPEVETVKESLKQHLIGQKIKELFTPYPKIIKENLADFRNRIINQTFRDIRRYGKYLLFILDDYTLISHLRMEGKYYLRNNLSDLTKHEHVVFKLEDKLFLSYHDVRKFGTMELVNKGEENSHLDSKKLGPEANDTNLNIQEVYLKIHKANRPIKSILLDQSVITGLGNIYVDETLFLSKIHPEQKGADLSYTQIEDIIRNAKVVLDKAVALGGTTIRTYQSTLGVDGRFQNELKVHTRAGCKCYNCESEIVKIKVGGRGTYFCPTCQVRFNND